MRTRHGLLGLAVGSLALTLPARAGDAAAASSGEKSFWLFAGSDIAASIDGKYCPVVGVKGRAFLVNIGLKVREVPLAEAKEVRVTPKLKLANASAEIAKISGVLSSDAAREAQFQAMQTAMAMSAETDAARDRAQGEFMRADLAAASAARALPPRNDPEATPNGPTFNDRMVAKIRRGQVDNFLAAQTDAAQRETFANDALVRATTAAPNNGEGVEMTPELTASGAKLSTGPRVKPGTADGPAKPAAPHYLTDAGNGVSDRFDLEFQISSAQRLEKAYVILVTDFTGPKSAQEFRRVTGERVGTIDAKPRKVALYQTGFPAGFHVMNYRVVLLADGQEVATNLIENRAGLTEDQAYQYILNGYLESHQGQTHPPAAMVMVPRSNIAVAASDTLRQAVYVTVDPNGKIISVSTDPNTVTPAPAAITDALRYFRFIPALEQGKPASGRAKLVVADFIH